MQAVGTAVAVCRNWVVEGRILNLLYEWLSWCSEEVRVLGGNYGLIYLQFFLPKNTYLFTNIPILVGRPWFSGVFVAPPWFSGGVLGAPPDFQEFPWRPLIFRSFRGAPWFSGVRFIYFYFYFQFYAALMFLSLLAFIRPCVQPCRKCEPLPVTEGLEVCMEPHTNECICITKGCSLCRLHWARVEVCSSYHYLA